jgi:hypothetical protein
MINDIIMMVIYASNVDNGNVKLVFKCHRILQWISLNVIVEMLKLKILSYDIK